MQMIGWCVRAGIDALPVMRMHCGVAQRVSCFDITVRTVLPRKEHQEYGETCRQGGDQLRLSRSCADAHAIEAIRFPKTCRKISDGFGLS